MSISLLLKKLYAETHFITREQTKNMNGTLCALTTAIRYAITALYMNSRYFLLVMTLFGGTIGILGITSFALCLIPVWLLESTLISTGIAILYGICFALLYTLLYRNLCRIMIRFYDEGSCPSPASLFVVPSLSILGKFLAFSIIYATLFSGFKILMGSFFLYINTLFPWVFLYGIISMYAAARFVFGFFILAERTCSVSYALSRSYALTRHNSLALCIILAFSFFVPQSVGGLWVGALWMRIIVVVACRGGMLLISHLSLVYLYRNAS